jgi:enamine deaminase RidA (YjgF/YER057c/UK114 family)
MLNTNNKALSYLKPLTICLLFAFQGMAQSPIENLSKLGIVLPKPTSPIANYVKYVQSGNLVFLSGHGPSKADGTYIIGKLGTDLTVAQGAEAAKLTGINLLATLQSAVGDLNKVKRIVKVLGFVNGNNDFADQPKVMNGFSDLMVAVFGEKGKHARSAIGTNSLPNNMAVEIEMVVELF